MQKGRVESNWQEEHCLSWRARSVHEERIQIMLNEHERLFIESFVSEHKRERLRYLMSDPDRRKRLRGKFSATFVFLPERS